MNIVPTPVAKAEQVLASMGITDPPALHLEEIAKSQSIRVDKKELPDDPNLSGLLLFRGEKRAILINTFIHNTGRINFTFAHELGHHFLQHSPTYFSDGQQGFHCTPEDMQTGIYSKETEANCFASALLMPEEQFRFAMMGAVLDYALISNLARQFRVSKHACCNRLLEFTKEPYIIVRSKGFEVTEIRTSLAARGKMPALKQIPQDTAAHTAITMKKNQGGFTKCAPSHWTLNLPASLPLYEWTHGAWEHGISMTILRF